MMHQCSSDCEICITGIDKDNSSVTDEHAKHENQQSDGPSAIELECVAEKSKLEKIHQTVSLLSPNPTEIVNSSIDDDCKIIFDSPNTDEIEIVDAVIYNRVHSKKMSSNKIDKVNPPNKRLKKCSNSPETAIDLADIQVISSCDDDCKVIFDSPKKTDGDKIEIVDIVTNRVQAKKMSSNKIDKVNSPNNLEKCSNSPEIAIDLADIQEVQNTIKNITDSIVTQELQNVNDILENAANSVTIKEVQNINENDKIVPEDVPNNDLCEIATTECADNTESMSVPSSQIDFTSLDNTMECDLHSSEKCVVENTTDTDEIITLETSDDDVMGERMDTETSEYHSYKVEYDFTAGIPTQITGSWKEFSGGKKNNFTKGCKWAPDGSCIMTCSDDNKLRIFNLPTELWDLTKWSDISELEAVLRISEGALIYDYCWYPLMNSNDPLTCCFISTSRKNDVHMWDAYTGELRGAYKSVNHLDELVTPHSLSFDSDGEKIFCGFHNTIRVFDVNRAGSVCEERRIYGNKSGQCGIISCFAFTSADKNVSAAGSYQKSIGLYAEPYGELLCLLEGQGNGITQLQFSPDGRYLYSGGRKDPEIICWDIRNLGTVLFALRRSNDTNQRIHFDISRCGKYVVSGNKNGIITFWDVTTEPKDIEKGNFPVLVPVRYYIAHDDCVNGVSFHPFYPLLCSSSGQRKFPVLLDDDDDSGYMFSYDTEKKDNSLRLWWLGKEVSTSCKGTSDSKWWKIK